VIQVQDWAEIRHLYFAEELSQRAIAERLGVARKTVGLRNVLGRPASTRNAETRLQQGIMSD
jgi:transcriptional regulator with XRE-family HTH domain